MDSAILLEQFGHLIYSPDGVQKLRNLILDLAVRGKLVEQNPEDESASDLLERIKTEKQALYKAGEIRKVKKLFPIEKPRISYDLPVNWGKSCLGTIAIILSDGSHTPPPDAGFGIPMISGQNVIADEINLDASRFVTESQYMAEMERINIQADDVFLTIVGTIGRTAVVPQGMPQFCIQRSIAVIRTPILSKYLSIYLKSPEAFRYYLENAKGTAQLGIYLNKLSLLGVPIPPLAEQKRIVEKVDELMALCDQLEEEQNHQRYLVERTAKSTLYHLSNASTKSETKQYWQYTESHFPELFDRVSTIEELRATILQLAVMGHLVPQNPDDEPASELIDRILFHRKQKWEAETLKSYVDAGRKPPNNWERKYKPPTRADHSGLMLIPHSWVWTTTGELCEDIVPNRDKPKSFSGNIPWITLPDFPDNGMFLGHSRNNIGLTMEETEEYRARIIPENSVVMSCVGRFGLTAILTRDAVVNQQIHAFVVPDGLLDSTYLAYAIQTQKDYMEDISTSTTIAYLNKSKCNSVPIALPPYNEQLRIVAKINELMELCKQLEEETEYNRELSGRLFDSIIYHMFEGNKNGI